VWIVTLKCAGLVLIFDLASISAFDLPKSLFSRATEWLLLAVIVLGLLRFGIRIVPRTKLHVAVVLVLVANLIAAFFALDPFVALHGEFLRYLGLSFVIDMVVLYAAVAIGFRRSSDWALLLRVGAATAFVLVGYAVAQRVGIDPVPWGENPIQRPFATLGNAAMLGRLLSVAFGLSVGVAAFTENRLGAAARLAALGFVLVLVVIAGIVATRSSLLGFSGALLVGATCYLLRAPRKAVVRRVVLASLASNLVLGLVALSPLGDRARDMVGRSLGLESRIQIYRTAIAAFESRPLFGYGPDSFAVAYPSNRDEKDALQLNLERESSAHSWVLQALATTGIAGLASFLCLVLSAVTVLWTVGMSRQAWLAGPFLVGLAAYLADGLVTVGTIGVDWFPWVGFGAAAAIAGRREETISAIRRVPAVASIGLGLGAAIAGLFGLVALSASEEVWQARILWFREPNVAIEHAEAAVRQDPGRADYWNYLGLTREYAAAWRSSGDAYAEAARRAPYDARFWSNLALSRMRQTLEQDLFSGGAPTALAAARRGVEVDPNDPRANAVLAQTAIQFDQPDLGLSAAVNAVVLYPIEPSYDALVLRAARGAMDLPSAAASLERAVKAKDSASIRVAAGEIALRIGDTAGARVHANRAAQLAPSDPEVVKLIEKLPKS
jgi:O-antigen ligase/tetratricopeptide (TPR) repeat protein